MTTKERTIPAKKSLLLRVSSIETPRIARKSGVSCPPQIAVSAGMLIAAKNGKAEHSLENRKTNQRTLPNVTRENMTGEVSSLNPALPKAGDQKNR